VWCKHLQYSTRFLAPNPLYAVLITETTFFSGPLCSFSAYADRLTLCRSPPPSLFFRTSFCQKLLIPPFRFVIFCSYPVCFFLFPIILSVRRIFWYPPDGCVHIPTHLTAPFLCTSYANLLLIDGISRFFCSTPEIHLVAFLLCYVVVPLYVLSLFRRKLILPSIYSSSLIIVDRFETFFFVNLLQAGSFCPSTIH